MCGKIEKQKKIKTKKRKEKHTPPFNDIEVVPV